MFVTTSLKTCRSHMVHSPSIHMNALDTLPQLQQARLNGISGTGYAEKWESLTGQYVRGVVLFDEKTDLDELRALDPQEPALFRGMVYSNGAVTLETLTVDLRYIALDELEPGITFRARMV